jgi:beta-lactamase regulating signal transducer with metallopeptidase domain
MIHFKRRKIFLLKEVIMFIWILLGVILLFLFIPSSTSPKFKTLKQSLDQFLEELNINVRYQIVSSPNYTFTKNKSKIYLYNQNFSNQTLFLVCLHEIAHILCDEEHHTPKFYQLENDLIQNALQKGYIKSRVIDPGYPCSH